MRFTIPETRVISPTTYPSPSTRRSQTIDSLIADKQAKKLRADSKARSRRRAVVSKEVRKGFTKFTGRGEKGTAISRKGKASARAGIRFLLK